MRTGRSSYRSRGSGTGRGYHPFGRDQQPHQYQQAGGTGNGQRQQQFSSESYYVPQQFSGQQMSPQMVVPAPTVMQSPPVPSAPPICHNPSLVLVLHMLLHSHQILFRLHRLCLLRRRRLIFRVRPQKTRHPCRGRRGEGG